jgi:hypothetical protein
MYITLSSISGTGGISIEGTPQTSFSSCIATDKGGAIFLEL